MNRLILLCLFSIFTGWMAFGNDIPVYSGRKDEHNNPKGNRNETPSLPKVTQEDHSVIVETDKKEENIWVEITTQEGETICTCQETDATILQVDNLDEGDYTIEIKVGEDSYVGEFSI